MSRIGKPASLSSLAASRLALAAAALASSATETEWWSSSRRPTTSAGGRTCTSMGPTSDSSLHDQRPPTAAVWPTARRMIEMIGREDGSLPLSN